MFSETPGLPQNKYVMEIRESSFHAIPILIAKKHKFI